MKPPIESHDGPDGGTAIGANPMHVNAFLDDLSSLATHLAGVSNDCWSMSRSVAAIEWNLPFRGDVLSPGTSATCAAKIAGLTLGTGGLPVVAARATALSTLIHVSVAAYENAEVMAQVYIERVRIPYDAGRLAFVLGTLAASSPWGHDPVDVMSQMPWATDAFVQLIADLAPGDYNTVMGGVGLAATYLSKDTGTLSVRQSAGPADRVTAPSARSIADAAGRTSAMYEDGETSAHVQVQRVVDPATGKGAWTVMIPGTSSWAFGASAPFDALGNAIAPSGLPNAGENMVTEALTQAMRKEGVLGAGEPVMLVGHSQGGMVATNMAARHATTRRFNITDVVTFGSPVGTRRPPEGVRALNVENSRDPVPRLDGSATGKAIRGACASSSRTGRR